MVLLGYLAMVQMYSLIDKMEYHVAHQAGNVSYLTNAFRVASCNTGTLHLKRRVCTKQNAACTWGKILCGHAMKAAGRTFFVVA